MADVLEYKGYTGSTQYSAEDEVFWGKLLGIRALVTFESETAKGLRPAFEEAVDDYLAFCEQTGKAPEQRYLDGNLQNQ